MKQWALGLRVHSHRQWFRSIILIIVAAMWFFRGTKKISNISLTTENAVELSSYSQLCCEFLQKLQKDMLSGDAIPSQAEMERALDTLLLSFAKKVSRLKITSVEELGKVEFQFREEDLDVGEYFSFQNTRTHLSLRIWTHPVCKE